MSPFTSRSKLKRLYAGEALPLERSFQLSESLAHYVSRVLRLVQGTHVLLFDAAGKAGEFVIREATRGRVRVERVSDVETLESAACPSFHVACGLSKGGKPDEIVRRITELGARVFYPLRTSRTVSTGGNSPAKQERWTRIAGEAARQCQGIPLRIEPMCSLDELLAEGGFDQILVAWVGEGSQSLAELLHARDVARQKILLLFGPEGGWSEEEVERIAEAGGVCFSLGPRILRAETAPVAALAIAQSVAGDLVIS